MDSLITTFHIDWHLIIAQAINFLVVLLVLYFFALKPLAKLMDERGKTIQDGLDNAKLQEQLLASQKAEYDATLAQARVEATQIMKEVKKDAESKRIEMLEKAKDEVSVMVASGKKQLESEKNKMVEDAKKEIVAMVVSATEKVVGENVAGKVESKMVEETIKNI